MEVNENVDDVEGDQERHFVHLYQTDSHLLFHRKISFFFFAREGSSLSFG